MWYGVFSRNRTAMEGSGVFFLGGGVGVGVRVLGGDGGNELTAMQGNENLGFT